MDKEETLNFLALIGTGDGNGSGNGNGNGNGSGDTSNVTPATSTASTPERRVMTTDTNKQKILEELHTSTRAKKDVANGNDNGNSVKSTSRSSVSKRRKTKKKKTTIVKSESDATAKTAILDTSTSSTLSDNGNGNSNDISSYDNDIRNGTYLLQKPIQSTQSVATQKEQSSKTCDKNNEITNDASAENENEKTTKKSKVYLTHRFIIFQLGLYILCRMTVSTFCHFDESQQSYDIQGNHKTLISQQLCQSSYSYLDHTALIVQPYVPLEYSAMVPKGTITLNHACKDSNCSSNNTKDPSTLMTNTEQIHLQQQQQQQHQHVSKKTRNPIKKVFQAFQSALRKILHFLFKRNNDLRTKKVTTEKSPTKAIGQNDNDSKDSNDDDEDDELATAISPPLELEFSSQQSDILVKTGANFLQRLEKEQQLLNQEEDVSTSGEENSVSYRLQNMFWGGDGSKSGRSASFPWWFPQGTNIMKDDLKDERSSGTRLLASYLSIMSWPENLNTKFPYSHLCTDGCPTDFALAHTLEFREKYKPWAMTPSAYETSKVGWVYVRGYSPSKFTTSEKGGSSVLWYRPGLEKIPDTKYEPFTRVLIQGIDTCIADALQRSDGKVGKCNILLDANGFGLSYIPAMGATKKLLTILKDHLPSRLGVLIIANAARPAQIMLNLVLPFLSPEVRRKIHLLPTNAQERAKMLSSLVEEEFVPVWLGGSDDYVFDAEEYHKNGNFKTEFISDEEGLEYLKTMPYHSTK